MKFQSRKDFFWKSFAIGINMFLFGIFLFIRITEGFDNLCFIFLDIVLFSGIGLLTWIYFGTEYELTDIELKYKSGPLKGEMKLEKITEIVVGKMPWIGEEKPGTAFNGLIVKNGRRRKIYITPSTNKSFIKKILELNDKIRITYK